MTQISFLQVASPNTLQSLITALSQKTAIGEAKWKKEEEVFVFRLEPYTFRLGKMEGGNLYKLDVLLAEDVFVDATIKKSDVGFDDIGRLYNLAAGGLPDIPARIDAMIEKLRGRVPSELPSIAPTPPRPTVEQAQKFFEKIAGNWHLKFEKRSGEFGTEDLRIETDGRYFTFSMRGEKPIATTVFPKYRLLLLSCDESLENVEISKQELNGRQRQVEVLKVTGQQMTGFAKHDEHALLYRKV